MSRSPRPVIGATRPSNRFIADLKGGPLAHMLSGRFAANSAWTVLAAIAFNLTRAAGARA